MQTRKQNRLPGYDYSMPGYYFVTICVQNRLCCFGDVTNSIMVLNQYGKIAEQGWVNIPKFYNDVSLGEFIVMPNHLHGIIIIAPKRADGIRPYMNSIGLSKIIGYYKQFVTKNIHLAGYADFSWQRSFYDNIVRSDEDLKKIREYIINNPLKWELDKLNPHNIGT